MAYAADEPRDVTLARVIALGFGGDHRRFDEFIARLRQVTPDDGAVILRGSAVTGYRWADDAPFDADGPGTSDLDVTFVGGGMINRWDEFYIPALHTVPLSDEHPEACRDLVPLRSDLCRIARRPVNLQATTSIVQFVRDVTMDQPWVELIASDDRRHADTHRAAPPAANDSARPAVHGGTRSPGGAPGPHDMHGDDAHVAGRDARVERSSG